MGRSRTIELTCDAVHVAKLCMDLGADDRREVIYAINSNAAMTKARKVIEGVRVSTKVPGAD